jgi:hypothetical protein
LRSVFGHVQHPTAEQIVNEGEIAMPSFKRFLIYAQMSDRLGLASGQATCYGALLYAVYFIPTQPQTVSYCLLAGCLQPIDGQAFEQRSEPATRLGPRQLHGARSVLGTIAAWRRRMQDRAVLASVEMPPLPLRLMIVERATLAALRARPLRIGRMLQVNVHFTVAQLQLHALHAPRLTNT